MPVLDPADLYQRLSRFTGNEVGWHPAYVEGEEGHVALVLVVDPPRWGDPIHRLARTSQDATGRVLEAGTAYVRKPGMTIAADASDLARLEKRASVPLKSSTSESSSQGSLPGISTGIMVILSSDARCGARFAVRSCLH